jgi:hypothetical protein
MSATLHVATPAAFAALLGDARETVRHEAVRLLAIGDADALAFALADADAALRALLAWLDPTGTTPETPLVLAAIDRLDDPAAQGQLEQVLMYARDPQVLRAAALPLARWDAQRPTLLRAALHGRGRDDLRDIAAELLDRRTLPDRQALRAALLAVAALTSDPTESPHPNGAVEAYLGELAGPYAAAARRCAEAHGASALAAFADVFGRLRSDDRRWLLGWAARVRSLPALNLIDRVLADADTRESDLLAALDAVIALGPWASAFAERVTELRTQHGSERVRSAATAACRTAEGIA